MPVDPGEETPEERRSRAARESAEKAQETRRRNEELRRKANEAEQQGK